MNSKIFKKILKITVSQPVYTIGAKDDPSQGLDVQAAHAWRSWKWETQPSYYTIFSLLKRKVTRLHPIQNRM